MENTYITSSKQHFPLSFF